MTTLTITLLLGAAIHEPVHVWDCHALISAAKYTAQIGGHMTRDDAGVIVRIACGGMSVDLAAPASTGPCEVGS